MSAPASCRQAPTTVLLTRHEQRTAYLDACRLLAAPRTARSHWVAYELRDIETELAARGVEPERRWYKET